MRAGTDGRTDGRKGLIDLINRLKKWINRFTVTCKFYVGACAFYVKITQNI